LIVPYRFQKSRHSRTNQIQRKIETPRWPQATLAAARRIQSGAQDY